MNIEKINNGHLVCNITFEELKELEVGLIDLFSHSERAEELTEDILEEADDKYNIGYEDKESWTVSIFPIAEGIMMDFQRDKETAGVAEETEEITKVEQLGPSIGNVSNEVEILPTRSLLLRFRNIRDVIKCAKICDPDAIKESRIYKDSNGIILFMITKDIERAQLINIQMVENGGIRVSKNISEEYLAEHYEKIIGMDALQTIRTYM